MSLKTQIEEKLNQSLKNKDRNLYPTLRLIVSGIKDVLIANRNKETKELTDQDVVGLLKKMIKQRNESIEIYQKNDRKDLLEVEQNEFDLLSSFLPQVLSDEETKKICVETINKLGATSIKDMGKVMGKLKKLYPDNLNFSKAGPLLKELLNK